MEQGSQVLQADRSSTLRNLVTTESGTALLLEYDEFRALQPGGVPPAEIERQAEFGLQGLTLLILDDPDMVNQPAGDWIALLPQAVLWIGEGGAPEPAWTGLAFYEWIEITTSGKLFSLRASR
jgi:hypothetical protein